jgi:S-adenosylmethionine:tRNA-ribosyltransferase-isomerase (queuine synthetase)
MDSTHDEMGEAAARFSAFGAGDFHVRTEVRCAAVACTSRRLHTRRALHEPGSSHYELLRAFADDTALDAMSAELETRGYRTHEFGDSVLIARQQRSRSVRAA